MCRNIKTLFNCDPPATDEEIRASALQFVRKLSGFTKPSQANVAAFDVVARRLVDSLVTAAGPPGREIARRWQPALGSGPRSGSVVARARGRYGFGTNARNRRGLSTRIFRMASSGTPAYRSLGTNCMSTDDHPCP